VGSFFIHSSIEAPPKYVQCDLREVLRYGLDASGTDVEKSSTEPVSLPDVGSRHIERTPSSARLQSVPKSPSQANRNLITTSQFERIWWDKGSDSRKVVSIWRPKPPSGYAVLGDCLVEGYVIDCLLYL
jgi:vacuolar protein sorting-associated protein 13A/C